MNTIQVNGSYEKIKRFIKEGGKIFNNNEFDDIIKAYLNYQNKTGLKKQTIIRKSGIAYLFLKYLLLNNIKFKDISSETIYNFLNQLLNFNWKLTYFDRAKFDFRAFLNWMYLNNIIELSANKVLPTINWHARTTVKSYYSKDEIEKLLNVINTKTKQGKEDFLIISFICYFGLRISDIINLKISNIDFNKEIISIIQYKTKTPLKLPLIDKIKYPLLDYLKNVRPNNANVDYIFITSKEPYENKESLKNRSYIIKKYLLKAGIDINNRKHGFHALRFSFSAMLLNENVDLYSISSILGHTNIQTTMLYLDMNTLKLKELALEVPLC